jgi:hypothetical protein
MIISIFIFFAKHEENVNFASAYVVKRRRADMCRHADDALISYALIGYI